MGRIKVKTTTPLKVDNAKGFKSPPSTGTAKKIMDMGKTPKLFNKNSKMSGLVLKGKKPKI